MKFLHKVFIDGSVGTTGLRIAQRLSFREDLMLINLSEEKRKDLKSRINAANESDITILCLPDDAAKEIVEKINKDVKICDTSTAHRTNDKWAYGFPEIGGRRRQIENSTRTAVPGCHASGFLAITAPLTELKILPYTANLSVFSLTGYTGGGKKMIAEYESEAKPAFFNSPRSYALNLNHKHLPEMCKVANLKTAPLFIPVVANFPRGMAVYVPLYCNQLAKQVNAQQITVALQQYYKNEQGIKVHPYGEMPQDGFMPTNLLASSDMLEIFCYSSEQQILLVSVFDNLGKGSSGAAIQCMNIMLGLPERLGLE